MRIRTIKPSFWSSATIAAVSREARLVFIGLWNIADDEGRLLGGAKGLAGALFEHDEDVDGKRMGVWLDELEGRRLIERYSVKGVAHICIPGFGEHQKIDKRFPSRLPPPPSVVGESPRLLSDGSEGSRREVGGKSASEVGSWKSEGGSQKVECESAAAPPAPPPPAPLVKTVQPTMSVGSPRRSMNRGVLGEDERDHEPKTPREYLGCAHAYPHHPAKPGEVTFAEALAADPNVAKAFDGKEGRWNLEQAVEGTGWGHWQAQDAMDRARWIWPATAPRRIEAWVKDKARTTALDMDRQRATRVRAESQGIDLDKPAQKIDPVRTELAKAYRLLASRGEPDRLPPIGLWIDQVIEQGRVEEELARMARTAPAATAGNPRAANAGGPPSVEVDRRASKAAYDAFCVTVPPQDRAAGLPSWREWSDAGSPPRWVGPLRQGSGGAPRQAPTSSAVNQPPAEEDPAAVDAAKAAFLSLGNLVGSKKRPLMPTREALDRQLPPTLASDGADR